MSALKFFKKYQITESERQKADLIVLSNMTRESFSSEEME